MWRSWTMPGCSAMQRNHWPPSLTTVVPASTAEHRRLVSTARKPRTTCKRACSGRPSSEVALAHGLHQLVLKPPSGVGRDPKPPAQLDVGDAFLALAKQMHGAEPHPHRQLGALQNGAGDQRRLVPASLALKQLTPLDLAIFCRCAPRTLEALRPAPGKPRLPACLLVWITLLETIIREALLVLHAVARHCSNLKIIVFSG